MSRKLKRREFLKFNTTGALAVSSTAALTKLGLTNSKFFSPPKGMEKNNSHNSIHAGQLGTVGDVTFNTFDPTEFLTHFDTGQVSK